MNTADNSAAANRGQPSLIAISLARRVMGSPKAITATAHKIAKIVYNMLKHGTAYVDRGVQYYEDQYRHRVVRNLHRRAEQLGFTLQPQAL